MNRLGGWHQPGLTEETSDWLGHAPELATFCLNCFSSVSSLPPATEGFPPGQGSPLRDKCAQGSTQGKCNVSQPHAAFLFVLGPRQPESSRNITWL